MNIVYFFVCFEFFVGGIVYDFVCLVGDGNEGVMDGNEVDVVCYFEGVCIWIY